MKFSKAQLLLFGADDGAYSAVTKDERSNSQITIAAGEGESEIAVYALGEKNIPRLTSSDRVILPIIRRSGEVTKGELAIMFPKPAGDELRIYRNKPQGFDYEDGDVWFLFRKGRKLTVGSMPKYKWDKAGRVDETDHDYQEAIEAEGAGRKSKRKLYYISAGGQRCQRDPVVALKALKRAKFECEFDPTIELFVSKATGKPYVEAHHFIPLSLQGEFGKEIRLDDEENIVSLSPHWHRAIHNSEDEEVRRIIDVLAKRTHVARFMKKLAISKSDIYGFYGVGCS